MVTAGDRVNLRCTADTSNPPAKFNWIKDNVQVGKNFPVWLRLISAGLEPVFSLLIATTSSPTKMKIKIIKLILEAKAKITAILGL